MCVYVRVCISNIVPSLCVCVCMSGIFLKRDDVNLESSLCIVASVVFLYSKCEKREKKTFYHEEVFPLFFCKILYTHHIESVRYCLSNANDLKKCLSFHENPWRFLVKYRTFMDLQ